MKDDRKQRIAGLGVPLDEEDERVIGEELAGLERRLAVIRSLVGPEETPAVVFNAGWSEESS
jgi:hypothetical protein